MSVNGPTPCHRSRRNSGGRCAVEQSSDLLIIARLRSNARTARQLRPRGSAAPPLLAIVAISLRSSEAARSRPGLRKKAVRVIEAVAKALIEAEPREDGRQLAIVEAPHDGITRRR